MIKPDEAVILVLGLAALLFAHRERDRLGDLPRPRLLVVGYVVLLLAWVATILEDLFRGPLMNTVEHLGYGASTVITALWCGLVFLGRREGRP